MEYLKLFRDLNDNLDQLNVDELENKMEELYKIKPVRIEWFLTKAKILKRKNKDIKEIRDILFKKYRLMYSSDKLFEIIKCLSELTDDEIEKKRLAYHLNAYENSEEYLINYTKKFENLARKIIDNSINEKEFLYIIDISYIRNDFIIYVMLVILYNKLYNKSFDIREWVLKCPNIESLIDRIKSNKAKTYVFVDNYNNIIYREIIVKALKELCSENDIYVIGDTVHYVSDNAIRSQETLQISIDNIEIRDLYKLIHPIEIQNNNLTETNISYIVEYLYNNCAFDNVMYIFSSGVEIERLCTAKNLRKNIERLSEFQADYFENNISICWSGDYLSYMSEFYGSDIHEFVDVTPECKFSIVLPVRNSIDTFQYTLKTCLELDYNGDYEIVISDNSSAGNTEVYDYISKLNDPKIKYYKTPRELPIPKSFEYAFLRSKGEFVFSLGADDGVLPWALNVLESVMDTFPNDDIIEWERGFYGWPEFNTIQDDQFIIPHCRDKSEIKVNKTPTIDYLKTVLENPGCMYGLPLLYINSGFKRSYLKKLLDKTGRLWDGHVQDLYIGPVNLAINNEILNVEYPLTIAGMSGHSMGKELHSSPKLITEICGSASNIVTFSAAERVIPQISVDVQLIQNGILRCISRGLFSDDIYKYIISNLDKLFEKYFHLYNKNMLYYEEYINLYRQCLKNISEDMLGRFDKNNYDTLFTPEKFNESKNEGYACKSYEIGFTANLLTLDASKFGVKNICDAKDLFKNIWGSIC